MSNGEPEQQSISVRYPDSSEESGWFKRGLEARDDADTNSAPDDLGNGGVQ